MILSEFIGKIMSAPTDPSKPFEVLVKDRGNDKEFEIIDVWSRGDDKLIIEVRELEG